ncbi:hypothetical protein MIR68_006695 [Amoeboaphelidium protococcarum]|nr:hypothetical protein MIR68_006695 [Amoeboaphelidium protococcarum]
MPVGHTSKELVKSANRLDKGLPVIRFEEDYRKYGREFEKDPLIKFNEDILVETTPAPRNLLPKHVSASQKSDLPQPAKDVYSYLISERVSIKRRNEKFGKYPLAGNANSLKFPEDAQYEVDLQPDDASSNSAEGKSVKPSLQDIFAKPQSLVVDDSKQQKRASSFIDENALEKVTLDPHERFENEIIDKELKFDYTKLPRMKLIDLYGSNTEDYFDSRSGDAVDKSDASAKKARNFTISIQDYKWQGYGPGCQVTGELYFLNTNTMQRVSEAFKFELGSQPPQCVASLTVTNAETIMIVRLYKPFEGELSSWVDTYTKGKQQKGEAVRNYMQPFGWCPVYMFEEVLLEDKPLLLATDQLFRSDEKNSDEDLTSMAFQVRSKNSKLKLKTIPLALTISVQEIDPSQVKKDQSVFQLEEISNNPFNVSLQVKHHMYCWLKSLNISKANSSWKNVAVKVELKSNDLTQSQVVETFIMEKDNVTQQYTSVINYHDRQPAFADEIKVALPLHLHKDVHLLFTFYHISYTHKKDDAAFAYAVLPVFVSDLFIGDGRHEMPLYFSLPDKYLQGAEIKLLDNGKPCFSVDIKLNSYFFPQEPRLVQLFKALNQKIDVSETDLTNGIRDLSNVSPMSIAYFWPVITESLLGLMCNSSNAVLLKQAFRGLIASTSSIHGDSLKRHPIVVAYLKCHAKIKKDWSINLAHEVLVSQWTVINSDDDQIGRIGTKYAWFLLELLHKLAYLHVNGSSKGTVGFTDRSKLYSKEFVSQLDILIGDISQDIYKLAKSGLNIAKDMNESLASFCNKMLSCYPVDQVFGWISRHVQGFPVDAPVMVNLKFDYLSIIFAFEFAWFLNLPEPLDVGYQGCSHFYSQLLLHEVAVALKTSSTEIRQRSVECMLKVFYKLETDQRYSTVTDALCRNFSLFLPYVGILCDNAHKLSGDNTTAKYQVGETKLMMLALTFVIKYADRKLLLRVTEKDDLQRESFFKVVTAAVESLKYQGKASYVEDMTKSLQSPTKVSKDNALKYIENAYKASGAGNLREMRGTLRQQLANKNTYKANTQRMNSVNDTEQVTAVSISPQELKLCAQQAHESSLVILHFLSDYHDHLRQLDARKQIKADQVLLLTKTALALSLATQSTLNASRILKLIGRISQNFSKQILSDNQCMGSLCESLIFYLAYKDVKIRNLAAELIYAVMKFNLYETKTNLNKSRVHLTVALSKFTPQNPQNLKIGLLAINAYAQKDSQAPKTLSKMVSDCVITFVNILKDNVRLQMHRDDPEMQEDMYYKLAQSYVGIPDIRLTVLESLAVSHATRNQFTEAGLCKIFCAAIVGEFLKRKGIVAGTPQALKLYKSCYSSFNDSEPLLPEGNLEEEGLCQSSDFSVAGFIRLMQSAIGYLRKGNSHEIAVEVHKILVIIYEKARNYEKLSECYAQIKDCYDSLVATLGKRVLATFFKVSFYGQQFGNMNGQSYIYKERSVTQLSEIVNRLSELYKKKFGDDFELINDSAKLDLKKLNPKKAYLAVVFVEPYFTSAELKERISYFDRMTNVNQFYFDMPYTVGGSSRGEVDVQCKKKTVLITEKTFPYLKKRVLISATKDVDLNPLEVSTEAIAEKCEKLQSAVDARPLNLKNLQLLLQGILRPQVNKGPLEIAQVFIENVQNAKKYPKEQIENLKQLFRDMFSLCYRGVKLSQQNSGTDQEEYNADLEEGYNAMKLKLDTILGDTPTGGSLDASVPVQPTLKRQQEINESAQKSMK